MDATTRLALPFPELTDPPNGPSQIGGLAAALDDSVPYDAGAMASRPSAGALEGKIYVATDLKVAFISIGGAWIALNDPPGTYTSLPGSANRWDGMRIKFVADATNGVVWELEYESGATGAHKWRFIGGGWLMDEEDASDTVTSGAYADAATAGPAVTIPLNGDYLIAQGAEVHTTATGSIDVYISFDTGSGALDADGMHVGLYQSGDNQSSSQVYRVRRKNDLVAAGTVSAKYRAAVLNNPVVERRLLAVQPVRVG